ncbi:MAG: ABC transporter permease [Acidimicrobiia bacterium]
MIRVPPVVAFLARRVVWALASLLAFATVVFFAVNLLIPYDYATNYWWQGGTRLMMEMREVLGLGRSIWVRYLEYMSDLLTGGVGVGLDGTPVIDQVMAALPITLLTFGAAGVVAYLLGDWLGRLVAWKRSRVLAGAASTVSVVLFTSFPPWLAFLLIYFGAGPLLRARSVVGLPVDSSPLWTGRLIDESDVIAALAVAVIIGLVVALLLRGWGKRYDRRLVVWLAMPVALIGVGLAMSLLGVGDLALDVLFRADRSLSIGEGSPLIAAIALILIAFGETMLIARAGVSAEMTEDYVLVAHAKGLPDRVVRDHHVGRNAVLPTLSRFLTGVPYLLTGLIILEREFRLGGLSSLFFVSIEEANTPLIIGTLLMMGVIGVAARVVLDLLHFTLDPRIRVPGEAA